MRVVVPIPLPNKANTYEIHFDPTLWKSIKKTVDGFRSVLKRPLYWVAPSKEVKAAEEAIAYFALQSLQEDTDKPVRLEVWISNRLDADAIKAIGDGIQKSGRIKNDRQIEELIVHKLPVKNTEFKFDITLI